MNEAISEPSDDCPGFEHHDDVFFLKQVRVSCFVEANATDFRAKTLEMSMQLKNGIHPRRHFSIARVFQVETWRRRLA